MVYEVQIKPKAIKDCKKLPKKTVTLIFSKIENLQYGLSGQVKQLTNHTPEYRLRVGDYRILFEIEGQKVVVYRIRHRREAYK